MIDSSYKPRLPLFRLVVKYGLIAITLLLLFGYIAFQARFLIQGPIITLSIEPERIQSERIIYLEGTTKNITRLSLNGRQIFTDERGYFKEALVLENGYTIATIAAVDRYGREARVVRSFIYLPELNTTEE